MKKSYAVYVYDPAGYDDPCPEPYKEIFFGIEAEKYPYVAPDPFSPINYGSCGYLIATGYREAIAARNRLNTDTAGWDNDYNDGYNDEDQPVKRAKKQAPVYAVIEIKE